MRNRSRRVFFFVATAVVVAVAVGLGSDWRLIGRLAAAEPVEPNFADPGLRLERPALAGVRAIRFLTTDDYPPLNFVLPDGSVSGFNVEIARAICKVLEIGCTVQVRPWDTLMEALASGKGDAVIASVAATRSTRDEVDFSAPYYKTPARFIVRRETPSSSISAASLAGRTVGVVAASAHEAYLKLFFPAAKLMTYKTLSELEGALKSNEISVAFGDGVTFSIWLNAGDAGGCCEFRGGPYLESRFFGEGVGIAVRKDDQELRKAFNWALAELIKTDVYSEIYMKYFPIDFY